MAIERIPVNVAVIESRLLLVVRKNKVWTLLGGRPEGGEEDISCLEREVEKILPGTELENYTLYKELEGKTPDIGDILQSKIYLADFKALGRPPLSRNLGAREYEWISSSTDKPLSTMTRLAVDALHKERYIL